MRPYTAHHRGLIPTKVNRKLTSSGKKFLKACCLSFQAGLFSTHRHGVPSQYFIVRLLLVASLFFAQPWKWSSCQRNGLNMSVWQKSGALQVCSTNRLPLAPPPGELQEICKALPPDWVPVSGKVWGWGWWGRHSRHLGFDLCGPKHQVASNC